MAVLKSPEEIEVMRQAGQIVRACLNRIQQELQPGITGEDIDELAEATIRDLGGKPSFKGYGGYPATVCISVNDEVAHGIPNTRRFEEGDIVGIDVGVIYNGYQGDAAETFAIGEISPEAKKLMSVTKAALYLGIDQAKAGKKLVDVSRAIQHHAEKHGYSIVRDLVGHGIGREMHEPPQIPHYVVKGNSTTLQVGMTLAIEPMVNIGDWRIKREADGWTYKTCDGSLSAHFEHTIAITDKGPLILTKDESDE